MPQYPQYTVELKWRPGRRLFWLLARWHFRALIALVHLGLMHPADAMQHATDFIERRMKVEVH